MRWFYRSHRVIADAAVPPTGAVLLIGNHPNDLPDVLTGYLCTDRPVRYLATVSVTESWAARKTYAALDVIPVVRVRDARKLRKSGVDLAAINIGATRSVIEALRRGEVVGAFPQGGVHDTPGIGRLRTGVAQMLLEYLDSGAMGDVTVVPFGVHYDAPSELGSDVVCHVGQPFSLKEWAAQAPLSDDGTRDATALTERLAEALRSVTRNALTWEEAERRDRLVAVWSAASSNDPLAAAPSLAPKAAQVTANTSASHDTVCPQTIADRLGDAVERAGGRSTSAIDHGLLRQGLGLTPSVRYASTLKLALMLPLAALGWLIHAAPWRLVAQMARKLTRERSDFAARSIVPGVFVLLAWYVLLSVVPLSALPMMLWPVWLLGIWTLGPATGDAALWWQRARRAVVLTANVRRLPASERERLRALAASLTLPGSPPADS